MNRPTRITLIAVVILLLLGSSVYAWRSYSNKQKLRTLQTEMAAAMKAGTGGPPTGEGRERFREIRKEVEAMPEAYQHAFRDSMGRMFRSRDEQRMDEFFKLTPAERVKELDKRIAQDEKRRKEWQQRQNNQQANAGGANGGPGAAGGNRGGGPGGFGGPRGGGFGGNLDRTTPEQRAKRDEYRREMNQRRAQLGLPTGRR